jgi:hypothetical protein
MEEHIADGGTTLVHPDQDHGPPRQRERQLTIQVLPIGGMTKRFKLPENAALMEVLVDGARELGVALLPPSPERPLDRLHNIVRHDQAGPAIEDLDQSLGDYLKEKGTTNDFGIELVVTFRVNTRWAVATKPEMSPKEILALPAINLNPSEYTLYAQGGTNPLPLDTPIQLTRGQVLEAQRDGKYGGRG